MREIDWAAIIEIIIGVGGTMLVAGIVVLFIFWFGKKLGL